MLRILESAFNKMRLNIFKLKLFLKEINHKFLINTILTGVDISREKTTLRESMDTDMTLGNDDETTPSARVLDMVIWGGNNHGFRKWMHPEQIA